MRMDRASSRSNRADLNMLDFELFILVLDYIGLNLFELFF